MTRSFQIAGLVLLALAALRPGLLYGQTGSLTPLTAATVVAALQETGLNTVASQIELPVSLGVAGDNSQLRVTAADLFPDGTLRVRLACRQAGACQPFLATVRSAAAVRDFAILQKSLQTAALASPGVPAKRLLAGQHATLLIEDARMRIALPVVAIDTGAPGEEVRVSSLDRKQTFRAVVADAATVRGNLP